ncbi:MAG: FtsH protease activity modulator HflK [Azoarcus sp.]|nr:FtsH protease activity modulator HflK [Azoarcus sp.]
MSLNDPHWGNRDGNKERGGKRGGDQGPPDLEEIWQDFNRRLSGMFGRRRGGNGNNGGGSGAGGPDFSFRQFGGVLGAVAILAFIAWLFTGFYMVDTNERGVVLRMGKFAGVTDPGLHWRLPRPIETHEIVDLTGLRTVPVGGRGNTRALMLTDDLNIVNVQFAVQYVLDSPENHIFENREPNEEFVRQIAETAMRGIVGKSKMDFVLYEGREQIADAAQKLIQEILNRYKSGIQVSRVTMEEVQPPEQVQAAFDDATKATQDWERQKNEGEAYANKVIPLAQGTASRLLADAQAYRAKAIASAEGETARFRQVLTEFKRAPQVTRERMYIETVQHVYSRTSKVMVDDKGGSNLLLLPLDKLVQQAGARAAAVSIAGAAAVDAPAGLPSAPEPSLQINPRDRDLSRDRGRGER